VVLVEGATSVVGEEAWPSSPRGID
jgi:hypothetical protein